MPRDGSEIYFACQGRYLTQGHATVNDGWCNITCCDGTTKVDIRAHRRTVRERQRLLVMVIVAPPPP